MEEEVIYFTSRELQLFRKLLFMKSFEPGTENSIAKQLDGSKRGPITHEFVKRMIIHSCLTFVRENESDRPVYQRNKKDMIKIWKKTPYFKISKDIIKESKSKTERDEVLELFGLSS